MGLNCRGRQGAGGHRVAALLVVASLAALLPTGAARALTPLPPHSTPPSPTPKAITATAAVAVSLTDNGALLFARNPHARFAPASLTKIVTALVARDQYDLDRVVTVSPLVRQIYGSAFGLKPGDRVTVRDLLYMMLLPSANDAAVALAADDPLGYNHFIQLMNEKARALGAYDSTFRNPHGLDTPGHVSSAWDMAIFGRALLADPVLAAIVSTRRYAVHNGPTTRVIENHNELLMTNPDVFGVKTGFTNNALHGLVCALHTPLGDILTVVMHSQDIYGDTKALWTIAEQRLVVAGAGGGPIRGAVELPTPPPPPRIEAAARRHAPRRAADARDDLRWTALTGTLALLALLTFVRRRRHPLHEAAELYAWMDRFVPRSGRRR